MTSGGHQDDYIKLWETKVERLDELDTKVKLNLSSLAYVVGKSEPKYFSSF